MPLTDGGDGFGEVVSALMGARQQKTRTVDAAHRGCTASWWWEPNTRTAIIESAKVIGLAMLPAGRFHPFELDTFGLGNVLKSAASKGARSCLIGIGGSATNDGGFGVARALGWQFLDRNGNSIEQWVQLSALETIRRPRERGPFPEMAVAVDVKNPLLGRRGATRVYGPQKGLRKKDFSRAELALRKLSAAASKIAKTAGSGAAGGLGFGLGAFAGAELQNGFELFSKLADLERYLREVDLVVTGEGRIDRSTFMGKAVGQVTHRCKQLRIPCIALAGSIGDRREIRRSLGSVNVLTEMVSTKAAMRQPERWLRALAQKTAAAIHHPRAIPPRKA